MSGHLLIFGLGYTGAAAARLAVAQGWQVTATVRTAAAAIQGVTMLAFDQAGPAIAAATHVLATAPPGEAGDPVLAAWGPALAASGSLRWIGYLSTTGVYGDRGGGWVDEATPPVPTSPRARRRVAAEAAWETLAGQRPVDVLRLAGIYGPGRSVLDDLRAGTARRVIAPDHLFGRIHRDDIAGAVLAAAARSEPGIRILNGSDDVPAASAEVIAEGARLLGLEPPVAIPLAQAWPAMSPMARSFWAENRRVSSRQTQHALGRSWAYPSFREGLRAVLEAERG